MTSRVPLRLPSAVVSVALLSAIAGSLGCAPGSTDDGLGRTRADGGGAVRRDGSVVVESDGGSMMSTADGGAPDFDAGSTTELRGEICGNEVDDDDDGMIDDGCGCTIGDERPCYLGPPATRRVGACRDGVQRCTEQGEFDSWGLCMGDVVPTREVADNTIDDDCDGTTDEPDAICIPMGDEFGTGGSCTDGRDNDCDTLRDCDDPTCIGMPGCPSACAASEFTCFGGRDDDCDGATDCDDAECFGSATCVPGPCPAGQTPTYSKRMFPSYFGGSSIETGDGRPVMPMTCEPGRCPAGLVAVQTAPGGTFACVPPPPACPAGKSPNYVSAGRWECTDPCDLVIHYGSIYGGLTVCAGTPTISCPSGEVPTFVYETETWECRRTCDNGLYDQHYLGPMLVCVPC